MWGASKKSGWGVSWTTLVLSASTPTSVMRSLPERDGTCTGGLFVLGLVLGLEMQRG